MKRVVVTGIGAITPLGNDVATTWKNLIAGKSGAAPITHFDASKFKTRFACEVKDFNILDYMDKAEARKHDPFSHYAMVSTDEAVRSSGIDFSKADLDRCGVIWGSGDGGMNVFEEQTQEFLNGDGTPHFSPFFITKMIINMAAGHISIKYGLRGINFSTVAACATSNAAIIDAFNYIRWGKADVMVAGGSEAPILASAVGGFSAMRALSTRNDDPASASRPFSIDRDGFVLGEGGAAIILEEYEHAMRRGAPIYAEIVGSAMTSDAYHLTASHPEGDGAYRAMKLALDEAGISPAEVDYINAHATSTHVGDVSETRAISRLFGTENTKLNVSATKSMTGHLLGAAGALESITAIMAIKQGIIPPTINTKEVDPEIPNGIDFTLGEARKRTVNVAINNTFGFGGHVTSIAFRKLNQ